LTLSQTPINQIPFQIFVKTDYSPFTFYRSFPHGLNVTTRLASSIIDSPVLVFLTFLADLSLILNLPNPDNKTSLLFSRLSLIIRKIVSSVSVKN